MTWPTSGVAGSAISLGRSDSQPGGVQRREFLRNVAVVSIGGLIGRELWEGAFAPSRTAAAAPGAGAGPYGPLRAADANGLQLPEGFTSRVGSGPIATATGRPSCRTVTTRTAVPTRSTAG